MIRLGRTMTKDELVARLRDREDNFVERKPDGLSPRDIRRTACAFANTVYGREAILFIGVHDKTGEVLGVRNVDQLQRKIRGACQEDCYPPINYTSEVLTPEGKMVVAVVIPPSDKKPHFTGPAFVRVGAESVNASPQQFEELVLSRIDKCREILRYKGRGLISVWAMGYQLKERRPVADAHYRERAECLVRDCTAHVVTLEQPAAGGAFYAEPLARVEVSYDTEKARPLLVIHYPRG